MSHVYVSYNLEYIKMKRIDLIFLFEDEWNRVEGISLIKIIQGIQRRIESEFEIRLEVNIYSSDELTREQIETLKAKAFHVFSKSELKAMDYETFYHHVSVITNVLRSVIQNALRR